MVETPHLLCETWMHSLFVHTLHLFEHWPLLCPLTPDGWSVQAQEGQHSWCSPWLCSAHHQHNRWATAGTGDCNARWDTCAEEATLWGKSICPPMSMKSKCICTYGSSMCSVPCMYVCLAYGRVHEVKCMVCILDMHAPASNSWSLCSKSCMNVSTAASCVFDLCFYLSVCVLPWPQLQTLNSFDQVDTSGHTPSVDCTSPVVKCSTANSAAE